MRLDSGSRPLFIAWLLVPWVMPSIAAWVRGLDKAAPQSYRTSSSPRSFEESRCCAALALIILHTFQVAIIHPQPAHSLPSTNLLPPNAGSLFVRRQSEQSFESGTNVAFSLSAIASF